MKSKPVQALTQFVGIVTILGLAIYGLLSIIGYEVGAVSADTTLETNAVNAATIPATFNYEGTLRESNGDPVNRTTTITAKIYDDATAGSLLFTEIFANTNVRDGQFNILLGDPAFAGNQSGMSLATVFEQSELFIGITIGTDSELIPRERVHAVPWALRTENAANADNALDGVPVGGVIDWWSPLFEPIEEDLPDGWAPCDGRYVDPNDPRYADSPLRGYNLPDLREKFIRGANSLNDINDTGGSETHDHEIQEAGAHNHLWLDSDSGSPNSVWTATENGDWIKMLDWSNGWDDEGGGLIGAVLPSSNVDFSLYTRNSGSHTHPITFSSSLPSYYTLLKLCRLK